MLKNITLGILGILGFWLFYIPHNFAPSAQDYHSVTYRVAATDNFSITYQNQSDDTAQIGARNRNWEYSFRAKSGQFLYVSAQNSEGYGKIQCAIVVDGNIVKHTESDGGYVIASCSTSAP